jgi:hypothetical protein
MASKIIVNGKTKKAIASAVPTSNNTIVESPILDDRQISLFADNTTGIVATEETAAKSKVKVTIADKLKKELELRNQFVQAFNKYCYKIATTTDKPEFTFEIRNGLSKEVAVEYLKQNKFDVKKSIKSTLVITLDPFWTIIQTELSRIKEISEKEFVKAIALTKNEIEIKSENDFGATIVETIIKYLESEGFKVKFYNRTWTISF